MTALRRMPHDNPIPMTAAQYLRWKARKRPREPMAPITDAEIAAFAEKAGWNKPREAQ
jgi:dihydrodipicolinate synthase/N-acetylneuraminate lyase